MYSGTPVDVDTDPKLYLAVAEKFGDAYLEDPDINDETRDLLAPFDDRITWDAPLHSLADVKEMARKAINSKPSRFGSLEELLSIYELLRPERDRGLRRRPGRAPVRPRADPVPRLALSRLDAERRGAVRLQRPSGALGDADESDGSGAERDRVPLGRIVPARCSSVGFTHDPREQPCRRRPLPPR